MLRRSTLAIALLAVASFTTIEGAQGHASRAPEVASCDETEGQQVLDRLNAAREEHGLPALRVDVRLIAAATRHAEDMASHGFMAHEGSDRSTPSERILEEGYVFRHVSENVAAGQLSAAWVVDAWMNSPGHRANILSSRSRHVGIAYAHAADSELRHYWVANFGSTDDPYHGTRDGCHP